jgi:hypothetical protein
VDPINLVSSGENGDGLKLGATFNLNIEILGVIVGEFKGVNGTKF